MDWSAFQKALRNRTMAQGAGMLANPLQQPGQFRWIVAAAFRADDAGWIFTAVWKVTFMDNRHRELWVDDGQLVALGEADTDPSTTPAEAAEAMATIVVPRVYEAWGQWRAWLQMQHDRWMWRQDRPFDVGVT